MSYQDAINLAASLAMLINSFAFHVLFSGLQLRDRRIGQLTRRVWILEGRPAHDCRAGELEA